MTATTTLIERSKSLGSCSNGQRYMDLFFVGTTLYRHAGGKLFLRSIGGPAMSVDESPRWVSEIEAKQWLMTEATDPITGYNFTEIEADEALGLYEGSASAETLQDAIDDCWIVIADLSATDKRRVLAEMVKQLSAPESHS